ncbi:MAG: histidine phosphatase family protein [Nakamurella sp.]
MRLLLIRHGQTPSNVLGLLDTAGFGPELTDLGRQQAAALPETLVDERIDAIYASSQHRAQLTAAPLAAARGLQVQIRDGIREVGAGDLEMAGDDRSVRTYQQTVRRWMTGELDLTMPGGPSGAEVLARFDAVVAEAVDQLRRSVGADGTAVLVAHGTVLRLWATVRASDLASIEGALGHPHSLQNTGMIIVDEQPGGGWRLLSWAGRPIGGPGLTDETAEDPTGEDF